MMYARGLAACSGLVLLLATAGCAEVDDSHEVDDATEEVDEASSELLVSDWSSLPEPSVDSLYDAQDPAVATLNGTQFIVFRIDTDMYWKKRTAAGWTDRVQIPGQYTQDRPSLAAFNGFLYMVHAGETNRANVYMSRFDPATETWSQETLLSYAGFNGPPAIAAFDNKLFFVGALKPKASNTYPMWVGTMSTSELFTPSQFLGAGHEAATQPSLGVYGSKLFVAHRNGATGGIVYSSHNQGAAAATWTAPLPIFAGPSGAGIAGIDPSIASVNGYLHLVHTRPGTKNVWWTYFNSCTWSPEVTLGTLTTEPTDFPSLTAGGAGLVLLTTGPVDTKIIVNWTAYGMKASEYHAPPAPIVAPPCGGVGP